MPGQWPRQMPLRGRRILGRGGEDHSVILVQRAESTLPTPARQRILLIGNHIVQPGGNMAWRVDSARWTAEPTQPVASSSSAAHWRQKNFFHQW